MGGKSPTWYLDVPCQSSLYHRRTEADEVYLLGIHRQASPIERLQSKHREFQKRMMSTAAAPETPPSPQRPTSTSQRKVLGDATTTKTSARSSRTGSTAGASPALPQEDTFGSSIPARPRPNARMQVFVDPTGSEAQAAADSSVTPWEDLGTRKARVKENIPEISKAAGTTLRQPGRHQRLASASSGSRIPVFRDPPAVVEAEEMPPPSAPTTKKSKAPSQTLAKASFVPFRDDAAESRPSTPRFTPFRDEVRKVLFQDLFHTTD